MNNTKTLYVRCTNGIDEYMVSSIKLDGFYEYTKTDKCWERTIKLMKPKVEKKKVEGGGGGKSTEETHSI